MNNLGQGVYNPPDYYQSMITDPTQVPVQMYPGGGYPYGYPGGAVFGPYPGFYLGSRTLEPSDAIRLAKERQVKMMQRAAISDDPAHKYLSPTGTLNPRSAAAYKQAEGRVIKAAPVDPAAALQKKIITTVLIGAIVSALLR